MKKTLLLAIIILFITSSALAWKPYGRVIFDRTTAPTATDDAQDGYRVGDNWVDETNDKAYVLLDSTIGAAVWTETTGSSGAGGITVWNKAGETIWYSGATVYGTGGTLFYLNPTNISSDVKAIAVVPQSAIAGIEWDGVFIDGSTLDPSAPDAEIRGIYIDLSGVAETNSPLIEGIKISVPALEVAIHTDGEIHQDYDATDLSAGDLDAAHHIRIDVEGATAGEVDGLDVSLSGTLAAGVKVVALEVHSFISPVKQNIAGAAGFIAGVSVFITQSGGGVTVHATDEFASTSSDTPFMVADNDQLLIGANAINDLNEIIVDLDTGASKNLFLTFECSSGSTSWVTFIPADGTNGMVQSGDIESSLPTTMTQQVITSAGGAFSSPYLYWVRINRTRNVATGPTEDRVRTFSGGGETYEWDEEGGVTIQTLSVKPAGSVTAFQVDPDGVFANDPTLDQHVVTKKYHDGNGGVTPWNSGATSTASSGNVHFYGGTDTTITISGDGVDSKVIINSTASSAPGGDPGYLQQNLAGALGGVSIYIGDNAFQVINSSGETVFVIDSTGYMWKASGGVTHWSYPETMNGITGVSGIWVAGSLNNVSTIEASSSVSSPVIYIMHPTSGQTILQVDLDTGVSIPPGSMDTVDVSHTVKAAGMGGHIDGAGSPLLAGASIFWVVPFNFGVSGFNAVGMDSGDTVSVKVLTGFQTPVDGATNVVTSGASITIVGGVTNWNWAISGSTTFKRGDTIVIEVVDNVDQTAGSQRWTFILDGNKVE